MKIAIFTALIMLLLFTAGMAGEAEPDSLKTYYHEGIVVTPTRGLRPLGDLAQSVSLITSADFGGINARMATDVLDGLPGVFVNRTSDFGRSDVDIRGIGDNGRAILVLIDGRPAKMGLFGCTITHSIPFHNIERIELVRGPSSVLYGSDALGGVLNIITRVPVSPLESGISLSYGSFNTQQYRGSVGGNLAKLNYELSGNYNRSDGHTDNSGYEGSDINGRLGYQIGDKTGLALTGKYFSGTKHEPAPLSGIDDEDWDVWNDYDRWALDLAINTSLKGVEYTLKGYRNQGEHLFSDGWHSTDYTNGGLINAQAALSGHNRLTAGVDFRQQGGEKLFTDDNPGFLGEWDKAELGVFLYDEHKMLAERVIISAGVRYNYDEVSGTDISPQFGLVAHLSANTTIRGSVAKGFRSPQINELYIFPPANENLKPEIVWNYEAGIKQRLYDDIHLSLTGFLMDGSQLIETVPHPSPPPMFLFGNSGSFKFTGLEAELRWYYKNLLDLNLTHAFLNPGEKTTGRAGNKTDLKIGIKLGKFDFRISGQHVSDYYAADNSEDKIEPYTVVNSKLSYLFPFGLRPFFAVDNLMDTEYSVYASLPDYSGIYRMPGRRYTMGVEFNY